MGRNGNVLPGGKPMPYAMDANKSDAAWLSGFGSNSVVCFDPANAVFEASSIRAVGSNHLWGYQSRSCRNCRHHSHTHKHKSHYTPRTARFADWAKAPSALVGRLWCSCRRLMYCPCSNREKRNVNGWPDGFPWPIIY